MFRANNNSGTKQVTKVDYACQANIYLSEADYRDYFKKSISGEKNGKFDNNSPKIKQISQIEVQTDNTYINTA